MTWVWPWKRRQPCTLREADDAIKRAERDRKIAEDRWREVRASRRRADEVAAKMDKVYARNGFSRLFWDDLRESR